MPLESESSLLYSLLFVGRNAPSPSLEESLNKLGTSIFLGQREVQDDLPAGHQNIPQEIKEQENSVVWDTSVPGRVSPDRNKIKVWGEIPGRDNIL